jgi:hypothetical protein
MVDAEKAAKAGKKVKKKKKKKKKKKGGKKGKGKKKKKDPTADRALEHLYVEMVSNGILQQPLKVRTHSCMVCTFQKCFDLYMYASRPCHHHTDYALRSVIL